MVSALEGRVGPAGDPHRKLMERDETMAKPKITLPSIKIPSIKVPAIRIPSIRR